MSHTAARLTNDLINRARNEHQRVNQCECGDAVTNGQGGNSQPAAAFSLRPDLAERHMPAPHGENGDDGNSKNPDAGSGDQSEDDGCDGKAVQSISCLFCRRYWPTHFGCPNCLSPRKSAKAPAAIRAMSPPAIRPSITPGGLYPASFRAMNATATSAANARRQPITTPIHLRADKSARGSRAPRTSPSPTTAIACQQMTAEAPQAMAGTARGRTSGKSETALSTAAGSTHTCTRTDRRRKIENATNSALRVLRLTFRTRQHLFERRTPPRLTNHGRLRGAQWRLHFDPA